MIETQPEQRKKKRPKLLFVGGGNLSYELSFVKKHPKQLASQTTVSIYESAQTIQNWLKGLDEHGQELKIPNK